MGWGINKGNGQLPEVSAAKYPLSDVAHGNFQLMEINGLVSSSQLQETMANS